MAEFLESQLDFIFFFYGLAFILLGAVCFAIRRSDDRAAWTMLGAFGFIHGGAEWLDLSALIFGDSPIFAWLRTAVMIVSYGFLGESARLVAAESNFKVPGRWIYGALLVPVIAAGIAGGNPEANAVARYVFGLPSATATALVFAYHARRLSARESRLALGTSIGFALYAVAAGLIVPAAPIWPADVINYDWFTDVTGTPIQLVRGLLACWISFAIWSIWGQKLVDEMASTGYTQHVYRLFVMTILAMGSILIFGWALTQYLGDIYKSRIEMESNGQIALVSSHLTREMDMLDAITMSLAGSPTIRSQLIEGNESTLEQTQKVLDLNVEASRAEYGLVIDRSGLVVARSAGQSAAESSQRDMQISPMVSRSLLGEPVYQLTNAGDLAHYNVSYPIRDEKGEVIGAVVMEKSLARFAADLSGLEHPFMLTDRNGVVMLSNRPDLLRKPVWRLSPQAKEAAIARYGELNEPAMLRKPLNETLWTNLWNARTFVQRKLLPHSGWSIVTLTTARGIFASRVLGIVITLMTTATALVYLVGRERRIQDKLQMDRQMELEALAKNLSHQASTDALTGLSNRLDFDRRLLLEIARAERYDTPLSLVLYDIDRFKQVNDQFGHQAGDDALTDLSELVSGKLRKTDFLARWGGEEFVILVPHGNGKAAATLAESLRQTVEDHDFGVIGDVTCSFGIAELAPGDTPDSLVSRADAALYQAKMNGRNRVEVADRAARLRSGVERVA